MNADEPPFAPEPQTNELFDFIYKDTGRILSYYAQLFGGRLASFEESKTDRKGREIGGRAGFYNFLGGELKKISDDQSAFKKVIDPHDVLAIDVLNQLRKWIIPDSLAKTKPGQLFEAKGTLLLLDRHFLEAIGPLFDRHIDAEKAKPKADKEKIKDMKMVSNYIQKLQMPTAYVFKTEAGDTLAGTLKEENLDEPPSAFYFKNGDAGAQDLHLIGIKDKSSESQTLPATDLISASRTMATAMNKMLFPDGAIRVTPIALFRAIKKSPSLAAGE
jgi:hypothetical protein